MLDRLYRAACLTLATNDPATKITHPAEDLAFTRFVAALRGHASGIFGKLIYESADPYTIRIYVPDGDPEGVRVIDRMNWTGVGVAFPRAKWPETKRRAEFTRAGVYMLVGYREEDDLPALYIGPNGCAERPN